MRFENFGKPHSNELIAVWELHNLRRGALSLKEFIAKLRILVKKANYPVEHNKAKPASKCLELCDVRDQPHPFQLKKNISPERISRCVYLCWMLSRSPIPHTNQPEQSSPVQHRPGQCTSQSNCKMPRYQRLRQVDIPEQVHNEYTPWVRFTLLRLQEKLNGTIRLCLHHPRGLNKGIQRNPKYVRAIDDVIPKVSGASHLSIVDGRSGFWQVKLDDESNKLCTFRTPWTKYRWRRLPFGLTCNGDVFQE